jgi:hypothetical protein
MIIVAAPQMEIVAAWFAESCLNLLQFGLHVVW